MYDFITHDYVTCNLNIETKHLATDVDCHYISTIEVWHSNPLKQKHVQGIPVPSPSAKRYHLIQNTLVTHDLL